MGFKATALLGIQREGLRELWATAQVGLPSMLLTCSEWWFWEVANFITGYIGTAALAAQVAVINLLCIIALPHLAFCGSVPILTAWFVARSLAASGLGAFVELQLVATFMAHRVCAARCRGHDIVRSLQFFSLVCLCTFSHVRLWACPWHTQLLRRVFSV